MPFKQEKKTIYHLPFFLFVYFRVASWIRLFTQDQTIHEVTRNHTKEMTNDAK